LYTFVLENELLFEEGTAFADKFVVILCFRGSHFYLLLYY